MCTLLSLLRCISPFNAFKLCVSQPSASSYLTPTPFHKSPPSLNPKASPEEFSDKERLTPAGGHLLFYDAKATGFMTKIQEGLFLFSDQYRWADFDTAPVVKKRPLLAGIPALVWEERSEFAC
ncbi:hypothetical protein Q8A67_001106 [Cirrhinus molitorella]|uniref:Uncharacterized protein n=1 Tax=Cirrhinus molitorella TaxID=172907 RepID=A0AA88TXF0_9TELE|nr:hypothetical protein Q8A67_001106 [Cirrhinus molitorella]